MMFYVMVFLNQIRQQPFAASRTNLTNGISSR